MSGDISPEGSARVGRWPGGLLSLGLPQRLGLAGLLSGLVWLAVVWALA